jgi:hypothetical protein
MYNGGVKVKVGTLVREKEGGRFGGLIVKSDYIHEKRTDVLVQWADGTAQTYNCAFLEEISPFPKHIIY